MFFDFKRSKNLNRWPVEVRAMCIGLVAPKTYSIQVVTLLVTQLLISRLLPMNNDTIHLNAIVPSNKSPPPRSPKTVPPKRSASACRSGDVFCDCVCVGAYMWDSVAKTLSNLKSTWNYTVSYPDLCRNENWFILNEPVYIYSERALKNLCLSPTFTNTVHCSAKRLSPA